MTYNTHTRHLPPDLQELVDTIIDGVVALAYRVNSNSDSNSLGGTLIYPTATKVNGSFNPSSHKTA